MTSFPIPGRAKLIRFTALFVYVIASLMLTNGALAQDSEQDDVSPNISVDERFSSNFAALGIKTGGFTLFPTFGAGVEANDNIFGVNRNPEEDIIGVFTARADLRSNWAVNSASLSGSVTRRQYVDNSEESYTDYDFSGDGTYELTPRILARAAAGYAQRSEQRIDTQTATGSVAPIRFSELFANAETSFQLTRLATTLGLEFAQEDFDDGVAIGDGSEIDQDFRDRKLYTAYARGSIRLGPAVNLFSSASYQESEYSSPRPGGAVFQDSKTYVLSGGVAFDIDKVARGEISAGYESRNFDAVEFVDVSGANVSAKVEYFPTGLTTVTLAVDRSIEDSGVLESNGAVVSNSVDLRVDHELLRQLVVSAGANYQTDQFKGFDRLDKFFTGRIALKYQLGRQTVVGLEYSYTDLASSGVSARTGFATNAIGLSVEFSL